MMKRLLVGLMLMITAGSASAETITLQCNYSTKLTYSSGTVENSNGSAIVEINDYGKEIFIFFETATGGLQDISVSTRKDHLTVLAENRSTKNRWDVINERLGSTLNVKKTTISVVIDRNTGRLLVDKQFFFETTSIWTVASGTCEKINTSIKKF